MYNFTNSVNQFNPSDRETNYVLGRRAFINNIDNRSINGDKYTYRKLSNKCGTKCINGIPLKDNSSSTRIQKLRLTTIGSASMIVNQNQKNKLYNSNKNITINNNDVSRALSRTRSSGYINPRK
tara:strand:+ start:2046 stop:2417 length:372 start_codon:yes stop_codon:yes gene_type:complete